MDPVYVTTVTNRVRSQLASLWPGLVEVSTDVSDDEEQTDADPVRRVLGELEDLRECEHLGHGYWLPTPLRLVALSPASALVVGGPHTPRLNDVLGCGAERRGIARTVSQAALSKEWTSDERRWQPLDAWMGSPPPDLLAWLDSERQRASINLVPSSSKIGDFEIYWPRAAKPSQPQWFRWVGTDQVMEEPEELALCRVRGGYFGQQRYWWGRLTRGAPGIRLQTEAAVDPAAVRRLQYALDAEHGNPTVIQAERDVDAVTYSLRSALPAEERRLFFALATEVSERRGRYPIRLRVSPIHRSAVERSLAGLCIHLI